MNKNFQRKKGAAALVTLMILSTVLLLSGITLVLNSIDLNKSLKGFRSTDQLYIESRSCLEDALYKIQTSVAYTGTNSFTSQGITCQAVVTNDGTHPTYKNINISANDGQYYYTELAVADTAFNPIKILQ